jgi:NADPH2:quinone reductase
LVVTGAGGGVGSAAVALGAFAGARVHAIVSRKEQEDYAARLGASEVTAARSGAELLPHLAPWSVDCVLDAVAGSLFPVLVKALVARGRYSIVGAVAGGDVGFDVWHLTHGVVLTGYSSEELDGPSLARSSSAIARAMRDKTLPPPARTVVPLAEAARAHEMLERHEITGRVILVP